MDTVYKLRALPNNRGKRKVGGKTKHFRGGDIYVCENKIAFDYLLKTESHLWESAMPPTPKPEPAPVEKPKSKPKKKKGAK